jgi:hypothetical protein
MIIMFILANFIDLIVLVVTYLQCTHRKWDLIALVCISIAKSNL